MFVLQCTIQGRRLKLKIPSSNVFMPNLMSFLSATQMHIKQGDTFCDIGCGSGIHTILAAKLGAKMAFGVDINPIALRCAIENARLNGVSSRCRFFLGNLTEPLKKRGLKADVVVYNAPQFPARKINNSISPSLRRSVNGGPDGSRLNVIFIREIRRILNPKGRCYNPIVGWSNPKRSLKTLSDESLCYRELVKTYIPSWGRGNATRFWFIKHPGKIVWQFDFPKRPGASASMLEVYLPGGRPLGTKKPAFVEVDFRSSTS